jgi:hypothetical protein
MSHDYSAATIDLKSLIERESGFDFVKKANHFKFGAEYAGPCPFCNTGDDRFRMWPDCERPHWWCRACSKEGSPAQFLMDYKHLTFSEALDVLGLEDRSPFEFGAEKSRKCPVPYSPTHPPCKGWQEAGLALLERAERYLWSGKSGAQSALDYLRMRGFTDETIRAARVGYVPLQKDGLWFSEPFSHWGLEPDRLSERQREKGCVKVPPGILIPWFCNNELWKLAVKRLDAPKGQDYGQILGSSDGIYDIDAIESGKPVLLVEGEFDALSVLQEAGDLITPLATGSAKKGITGKVAFRWSVQFVKAPFVLLGFDNEPSDKNGARAGEEAARYWLSLLNDIVPVLRHEPWNDEQWRFKDANDMLHYKDEFYARWGIDLRRWVEIGMETATLDLFAEEMPMQPPLQGCGPSLPLEQCGAAVSRIVDVLGGPERVRVEKQDPEVTLAQYCEQKRQEQLQKYWQRI